MVRSAPARTLGLLTLNRKRLIKFIAGLPLALAGVTLLVSATLACAPPDEASSTEPWAAPLAPTTASSPTLEMVADLPTAALAEAATPLPTAALASPATGLPAATALSAATGLPVSQETVVQTVPDAEAEEARTRYQRLLRAEWDTDFTRTTISFDEIVTGGPPRDGIPSIDDPQFESIADADLWVDDLEPVQVVDINDDVRAYPVQVMVWHELVNDTVGGEPVVVTF